MTYARHDDPVHIRNYWARHRKLAALGVDGWWPDDGDELPAEARLARHRCYFEGPLADRAFLLRLQRLALQYFLDNQARNGLKYAFVEEAEKVRLQKSLEDDFRKFESRY